MKGIQLISLLFLIILRSEAQTNIICDCSKLEKDDCFRRSDCKWNFSTLPAQCTGYLPLSTPALISFKVSCSWQKTYDNCHQYKQCAWSNDKCIPFSSCLSSDGGTEDQCFRYSRRCHYSPSLQMCVELQICSEYSGEINKDYCQHMQGINKMTSCQYDLKTTQCRNKVCSDVSVDIFTFCNEEVEGYNCASDMYKCTSQLQPDCSSYNNKNACNVVITVVGGCELTPSGMCVERICASAPADKQAENKCQTYHRTCVFNGVQCTEKLVTCTGYSASDCAKYTGIYGKCILNSNQTMCQDPICENFIYTTNELCAQMAPGLQCITNGIKCVSKLTSQCDNILMSDGNCEVAISQQGKCKQSSNGIYCDPDLCSDHQLTTNDACNEYSKYYDLGNSKINGSCISNGIFCLKKKNCNEYTTNEINGDCSNVVGYDGYCYNDITGNSQTCVINSCEKILNPSQENCKKQNSSCKFDGFSCLVNLLSCSDYSKDCDKVITYGSKCYQTSLSPVCVEKNCESAPHYLETDQQCSSYLFGCLTNGAGCVSQQKPCSFYQGTHEVCRKYKGSDGVCIGSNTVGPCSVGDCESQEALADFQCQYYSPYCLYDRRTRRCAKYIESCESIATENPCLKAITVQIGRLCQWSNSKCQNPKTYLQNCEKQVYDCIMDSNENYCIKNQSNNVCQLLNSCEDYKFPLQKDAENNIIPKSNIILSAETQICQAISPQCYSNGISCFPYIHCRVFTNIEMCKSSYGIGGVSCGFNVNTQKCQIFGVCQDVVASSHEECQNYNKSCTSYQQTCISWTVCSKITDQLQCTTISAIDGKCSWNGTNCNMEKCQDYSFSTHSECFSISQKCTSDGTKCIDLAPCSNYTNQQSCQIGQAQTNQFDCYYDTNLNSCRNKICEDYTNLGASDCEALNCAFDSVTKSCLSFNSCQLYLTEAQCNNKNLKGMSCIWTTNNSSCHEFTQCSATDNENICNTNDMCFFGQSNATNSSICQDKDCYQRNLQADISTGCKPIIFSNGTVIPCQWNSTESKCIKSANLDKLSCMYATDLSSFWIAASQVCQSCFQITIVNNTVTTNTTNPNQPNNTTNNTNNTGTTSNSTSNDTTTEQGSNNNNQTDTNTTISKFIELLTNMGLLLILMIE